MQTHELRDDELLPGLPVVKAVDLKQLCEPYPGEHAARIRDPKGYVRFRRQNDRFGSGVNAIWGITSAGKSELQTIRFDASKFTVAQAKAWLKAHDYRPILFEPATGEKETKMTRSKAKRRKTESAVAPHKTPMAPREHAWDKTGARKRLLAHGEDKAFRDACAWVDPEVDGWTGGKLPHHDVIDGKVMVVWKGITAAAVVIQGGRGGLDIPTADMAGVKRHIGTHYGQFDEKPPWEAFTNPSVAQELTMHQDVAAALYVGFLERASKEAADSSLIEVFQPEPDKFRMEEVLKEVEAGKPEKTGLLRITAMVQRADYVNRNNRLYPTSVLKRETERLNAQAEKGKTGTLLDHPVLFLLGERLQDMCGRLTKTWMERDEVWAEFLVETTTNQKGIHLFSLLRTGFVPGVSSRGSGTTREEDVDSRKTDIVNDDYRLQGYDIVSDESVIGAELKRWREEQTNRIKGDNQKESTTKQEEIGDMDKEILVAIINEAMEPITEAVDALKSSFVPKAELDTATQQLAEAKASHEAAMKAWQTEKEQLIARLATAEKTITDTTPPEKAASADIEAAIAKETAYREKVVALVSTIAPSKAGLTDAVTQAKAYVTNLLAAAQEKPGTQKGQAGERVIQAQEQDEDAGLTALQSRGKELHEKGEAA